MSFAIVNPNAAAMGLINGIIQIFGDISGRVILKEFGVGKLHSPVSEKIFGSLVRSPQTFQKEKGFREFTVNAADDVAPSFHRDFIASIAAESIYSALTPSNKNTGQVFP